MRFRFHFHGPYCRGLSDELRNGVSLPEKIAPLLQLFEANSPAALELASTALFFFDKSSKSISTEQAMKDAIEAKPHCSSSVGKASEIPEIVLLWKKEHKPFIGPPVNEEENQKTSIDLD